MTVSKHHLELFEKCQGDYGLKLSFLADFYLIQLSLVGSDSTRCQLYWTRRRLQILLPVPPFLSDFHRGEDAEVDFLPELAGALRNFRARNYCHLD